MKSEDQVIAFAKLQGWRPKGRHNGETVWTTPEDGIGWFYTSELPDCLNDLNVTHEAEMALTDEEYFGKAISHDEDFSYNGWLDRITGDATRVDLPVRYKSATAAQRTEALLKFRGVWTS